MIKANELRIGNYVVSNSLVVEIKKSQFGNEIGLCDGFIYAENLVKPILLTNKWIINLGFKYVGIGEFELKDILIDCEYTDKGEFYFILNGQVINSVYYVHQLQNLYFAVKNKELEINETKEM